MTWQQPFIVIDQNQLRRRDAIERVLDDCCRKKLYLLIPDGAFFEFAKGGYLFDTARRSLQTLAPYRELVFSARKITDIMRDELSQRALPATLVQNDTTQFLRSLLEELQRGEETTLRRLADGPAANLMPPALDIWNNHDENRQMVQQLHDELKAEFSNGQLKELRRVPETGVSDWLSSQNGMRYVFQYLKARGADNATAYEMTRTPTVAAGFISATVGLALYWLAFGGLSTASPKELSADLSDIEYIVLGALSRSLATFDRRASIICQAVSKAFETRRLLPKPDSF